MNIDSENMLMKLGDRDPILVKRVKAWPFLKINAECWYAVDTNNQGAGIIEGVPYSGFYLRGSNFCEICEVLASSQILILRLLFYFREPATEHVILAPGYPNS